MLRSRPWRVAATVIVAVLIFFAVLGAVSASRGDRAPEAYFPEVEESSHTVLSRVYWVDQPYRSMMGPWSDQEVFLVPTPEGAAPELLWITGYRAVMVGPNGEEPLSQEYMCHSNLDLEPNLHRELMGHAKAISGRLFTLSQGQLEIDLPQGFGIPVLSTQPLNLTTQVLNLNPEPGEGFEVRHKVTVDFVRDADLERPFQPLFSQGAYGLASLEGHPLHFGREAKSGPATPVKGDGPDLIGDHGPGCLPGDNAAEHEYKDSLGRRFTGHWVVPPGRQVNRTLVTEVLNLPFDTTVHYIAVHLHPFAETLELKDLTTGETVFRSDVRPAAEGIGIEHVDYFESPEGLELYRDHEYELVSVYNNTSAEPQDSMAVMYMYLLDQEFDRDRIAALKPAPPSSGAGAQ